MQLRTSYPSDPIHPTCHPSCLRETGLPSLPASHPPYECEHTQSLIPSSAHLPLARVPCPSPRSYYSAPGNRPVLFRALCRICDTRILHEFVSSCGHGVYPLPTISRSRPNTHTQRGFHSRAPQFIARNPQPGVGESACGQVYPARVKYISDEPYSLLYRAPLIDNNPTPASQGSTQSFKL